jgi:UDP-N-acetylmuramoyl-tripeptide--D-alanyl-D-alanine ligase
MLTLGVIIEALCGIPLATAGHSRVIRGKPDQDSAVLDGPAVAGRLISSAVADSREATSGALFVALPGEHFDGHDYIDDAFEHGARVAFVKRDFTGRHPVLDLRSSADLNNLFVGIESAETYHPICVWVDDPLTALQKVAGFWRSKLNLRVIGITGSVGKSTSKEMIAEVLSRRFRTSKNLGNLNNEIGLPLTLIGLNESHERAVLEMGFYVPGEIGFLCDLAQPHIGVITNIGTVHAGRAGSQEAIARGKAELIQALPPAPEGNAILNYDDLLVRDMARLTNARVFYYGLSEKADLWADSIEGLGLDGISFRLHYRNEVLYLRVPMIGRHSVHTALRAAAVGLVEGLDWNEIIAGLQSGQSQLRLVVVRAVSGALILDDTYNASPESSLAALNLLDELDGRKVAILGDMLELGPYEKQGHELVGARAAEVVDELITLGERGRMIADAAWRAGLSKKRISTLEDSQQAIDFVRHRLGPNDVVLIKGSHGMQMDRLVTALEALA